jgi:hypothetical protein
MAKYTFLDLYDSKSFNISLLASLFVVFLIKGFDIAEHYVTTGLKIPNIWFSWVIFGGLLISIFLVTDHYKDLAAIQREIDAAKSKEKRK